MKNIADFGSLKRCYEANFTSENLQDDLRANFDKIMSFTYDEVSLEMWNRLKKSEGYSSKLSENRQALTIAYQISIHLTGEIVFDPVSKEGLAFIALAATYFDC